MEDSITYAKKYLEDIISFFGVNVDVSASHDEDVIELNVPSTSINAFLIGQRGDTLRSLQFLTSTALKNSEKEYVRVNIDVADYKKQRADKLSEQAEAWVKEVRESGAEKELEPMNAIDRRTVHQAVGEMTGVISESLGEGRDRRVVLKPVAEPAAD